MKIIIISIAFLNMIITSQANAEQYLGINYGIGRDTNNVSGILRKYETSKIMKHVVSFSYGIGTYVNNCIYMGAELTLSPFERKLTLNSKESNNFIGDVQNKYTATITSKIGYLINNKLTLYINSGLAYARCYVYTYNSYRTLLENRKVEGYKDNFGYVLGSGFDFKINDKLSIGLSYAYTSFNKMYVSNYKIESNMQDFKINFSYKI